MAELNKPWSVSKTGLTVMELMVIVIIVAILASLAIPQFTKTVERARADEAVAILKAIYVSQRVYRIKGGHFFPFPYGVPEDETVDINSYLNLDIDDSPELRSFKYSIVAPNENQFTATATRLSGRNENEIITIDDSANLDYSGWSP